MRRERLATLALAAGATAFALLAAELGLRAAGIAFPAFHRLDPELGETLDPGAEGWWTREGRSFVRISSGGLRDREHALVKPPGTLRIAVLGDSYAEAMQVERAETFWAVMERALAGCPALEGRRMEVLNLGVSGYGTAQELLALRHKGLRYAPDVVLLAFTTGNDVRNNSKPLQRGGRPYAVWRDGALAFDMGFLEKPSSRWRTSPLGELYYAARRRSRMVQLLGNAPALARRRAEAAQAGRATRPIGFEPGLDDEVYRAPDDPVWQEAWALTEALLRALRDESAAHGARFALATLSSPIQVHPDPSTRRRFAEALAVADLLYPDRRLAAFAAQEGIPFAMLVPPLQAWAEAHGTCVHGFENAEPCGGHWNPLGHRLVGEELAAMLCREGVPSLERDPAASAASLESVP